MHGLKTVSKHGVSMKRLLNLSRFLFCVLQLFDHTNVFMHYVLSNFAKAL